MSIAPHYCCQNCGFKINTPNQKCIACGRTNINLGSPIKIPYGKMKRNIKIKISLHEDGSRITDQEEFNDIDEMINWLLKEKDNQ